MIFYFVNFVIFTSLFNCEYVIFYLSVHMKTFQLSLLLVTLFACLFLFITHCTFCDEYSNLIPSKLVNYSKLLCKIKKFGLYDLKKKLKYIFNDANT